MHTLVNGGTRDKCQWVYLGFHRIQTALQENEAGNTTTISFLSLSLSFFFFVEEWCETELNIHESILQACE